MFFLSTVLSCSAHPVYALFPIHLPMRRTQRRRTNPKLKYCKKKVRIGQDWSFLLKLFLVLHQHLKSLTHSQLFTKNLSFLKNHFQCFHLHQHFMRLTCHFHCPQRYEGRGGDKNDTDNRYWRRDKTGRRQA